MDDLVSVILDEIGLFECDHEGRKPSLLKLPDMEARELCRLRPDAYPMVDDVTKLDGVPVVREAAVRQLIL